MSDVALSMKCNRFCHVLLKIPSVVCTSKEVQSPAVPFVCLWRRHRVASSVQRTHPCRGFAGTSGRPLAAGCGCNLVARVASSFQRRFHCLHIDAGMGSIRDHPQGQSSKGKIQQLCSREAGSVSIWKTSDLLGAWRQPDAHALVSASWW